MLREIRLVVAGLSGRQEGSLPVLAGLGEAETVPGVLLVSLVSGGKVDDFLILPLDACDLIIVGRSIILAGVVRDVVEVGVGSGPKRQLLGLTGIGFGVRRVVVSGHLCGHPRTCLIVNYII